MPLALAGARMAARFAPSDALEIADAEPVGTLDDIARHRRALVVTFRRNGTAVPTPVWAAVEAGRAYVRTERASGKVKRLRHSSRALLAPSTARGVPLGAPLVVRGRVLSSDEEPLAEQVLARRYGLGREAFERAMDLMRVDMGYLELVPDLSG